MTRVESLSPDLDAIGDWSAPEGSEPWAKALRIGLQRAVDKVDMYPRAVAELVDKATQHAAWTKLVDANGKPFPSFDAFCATKRPHGIGVPFETIRPYLIAQHGGDAKAEAKVAALTTRPEAAPRPGGKRPRAGRKKAAPQQEQPYAESTKSEHDAGNQRDCDNADSFRGTNPTYLAARIARDAPEVHEGMKAGKYPSVRAAAKAAGIVKEPDPVRVAARELAKVPRHRLAELVALIEPSFRRQLKACLDDAG